MDAALRNTLQKKIHHKRIIRHQMEEREELLLLLDLEIDAKNTTSSWHRNWTSQPNAYIEYKLFKKKNVYECKIRVTGFWLITTIFLQSYTLLAVKISISYIYLSFLIIRT